MDENGSRIILSRLFCFLFGFLSFYSFISTSCSGLLGECSKIGLA